MAALRRSLRESKERFAKKKQRWSLILAACGGAFLLIFVCVYLYLLSWVNRVDRA